MCTINFGHCHVLALLQHEAAQIKVCSLRSLLKTVHKAHATTWFCLLQPRASCLAIGVSEQPYMGQEGLAGPPARGADYPYVAPLFTEFSDIFSKPVVPLESRVTHNIGLLDPDT